MADDPKPGTPGGVRGNYEGSDVLYVDGKYINPHAKEEEKQKPKTKPKKVETQFGKRGLPKPEVKTQHVHNTADKKGSEKTGSEIVREVRARMRREQGKKF